VAEDKNKQAKAKATEAAADEAKAEQVDAEAEATGKPAKAEKEPKPKRRRAAETTTAKEPARLAPTNDEGLVEVRASARYVRNAPRKARLVMDHIRGKSIGDARAILHHTPRAAATDIAKLLESAVANAENNFELDPDELRIHRATVDEGPTIKRFQPRARGRATPILKRTSHMTITLTTASGAPAGQAGAGKAR
jgi:ribosomal protein L22